MLACGAVGGVVTAGTVAVTGARTGVTVAFRWRGAAGNTSTKEPRSTAGYALPTLHLSYSRQDKAPKPQTSFARKLHSLRFASTTFRFASGGVVEPPGN